MGRMRSSRRIDTVSGKMPRLVATPASPVVLAASTVYGGLRPICGAGMGGGGPHAAQLGFQRGNALFF